MPVAALPQGPTYFESAGRGLALVLIHGMGGDATLWDRHAAALDDRFRVIRYDIWGHGRSGRVPAPWRFTQFAAQLAGLLDHLGIERATVCGFSLGGNIAQCFALDYPARCAGLAIAASACARMPEEQARVDLRVEQVAAGGAPAVVDGALGRWFGPGYAAAHPEVVAYWRAKTLANDPQSYVDVYRLYADNDRQLLHRLSDIKAPTLILTGDEDAGQTPRMAEAMQSRIAGAERIILPGIRHMLPLEAADTLVATLRDFAGRCAR
ncbi:MAG: alpha/beta fold hydrolase [Dongiaceae bacterium]